MTIIPPRPPTWLAIALLSVAAAYAAALLALFLRWIP